MPTEEKTVTTETAAPKTGAGAFDDARASIAAAAKPASDDTPATPAQQPEKVADEPQVPTEETNDALELTEAEVQKLSLKDQKVYRALQKKFTETSQQRSALEKQFTPWKPLIDAITADPDKALEQLARERGYTVAKANQDTQTAKAHAAETVQALPEEYRELATSLEPILAARDKQLIETVRKELEPIRQTTQQIVSEAAAAETEGTLKAFEAEHKDWKQFEPKMLEIAKKFVPAKGQMTDHEYMNMLYTLATADRAKAEQTQNVIDKINKSAATAEPAATSVNASRVEYTMPPEGQRDIRAAFEAAKRGERWTR